MTCKHCQILKDKIKLLESKAMIIDKILQVKKNQVKLLERRLKRALETIQRHSKA